MAKNILLLFLSPIPTELNDSGKVVIRETEYKNIVGEKTKNTNESAFRYLLQEKSRPTKFLFSRQRRLKKKSLTSTELQRKVQSILLTTASRERI